MASEDGGKRLRRADPSTIQDKFMVGYQGWFTCPGDGEPVGPGHHGWLHWFNYPIPDGGRPNTDLWPDVSEYSPSELYPAPGLKYANGDQAFLFSSRNPKTVNRHFHWMARHGVDGAFLQRFLGQCDVENGNEGIRRQRDEVGDRVKEAAEKEGRVFAIMYDVSGVPTDSIERVIKQDWLHLIRDKGILDSPNYLREKGKPVIALWGFGFSDRNHSPAMVRAVTSYIRSVTPGGAYIFGGVPAHWRTSVADADPNPEFLNIWLEEFDALSPWTIGRYGNEDDADRFAEEKIKGDVELLKKRVDEGHKKVDYVPVVLPGGSGYNLSEGKWGFNDIKRNGGRFLWRQLWNARRLGVRTIYGAMWDEYDEGTAYMPVVPYKRQLPVSDKFRFMALDEDGYDLPSDWYMRICGFAAEGLRGERIILETFPSKELQDYWSTRPIYEDEGHEPSASGSGSGGGSADDYQRWLASHASKAEDEPPPPPYSLEGDSSAPAAGSVAAQVSRPPPAPMSTRPLFIHRHDDTTASAHSSAPPPPAPASTRPLSIHSHHDSTGAAHSSAPPPPPPKDTRPSSSPNKPLVDLGKRPSSASVSQITEDLGRQSISHNMPSSSRPPVPSSTRPVSPPSGPSISLPVPDLKGSPGRETYEPGGFAPALASQPQWPPPEWNVPPSPHSPSHYPGFPPSSHANVGPPPLRPRPSLSQRPPPGAYPAAADEPGFRPMDTSYYDPSGVSPLFPQAHPSNDYYSSGGAQGQGQWPYQAYEPPAHRPGSRPSAQAVDPTCPASGFGYSGRPSPPAHPSSPQPYRQSTPPAPHGAYAPPAPHGSLAPPSPHASHGRPSAPLLSAAPLRLAMNAVDRLAGPGTSRQIERRVGSIAERGNKIFDKITK